MLPERRRISKIRIGQFVALLRKQRDPVGISATGPEYRDTRCAVNRPSRSIPAPSPQLAHTFRLPPSYPRVGRTHGDPPRYFHSKIKAISQLLPSLGQLFVQIGQFHVYPLLPLSCSESYGHRCPPSCYSNSPRRIPSSRARNRPKRPTRSFPTPLRVNTPPIYA